ncbi:DUF192 domain-containing protein [Oleiagrimonas sp. MCCC 1A03011]|jgi:uncharacterized protein|uniref:DUF192 domain-containing protein n=1 Tax=Oleiagrimonas sp. MCCC 1A03011 TaxID=1926883 RepID=UPI000DC290DF|nr:DUF192 domain-containing protein [Oleiagrimonas sp. MCCC 1A03011]RAP57007.1 hypothetical protein BTJ49_12850 [Oleiagrimonas sp. MCCC 1A03011]
MIRRYLLLLVLTLLAGACAAAPPPSATHVLTLHDHTFHVELATNNAQRDLGLMHRTHMAADHGMLFVFPYNAVQTFWMKNTLIPLDMLFFDKDRKLVSMQLNVPPCKANPCALYPSGKPAMYVLELAAGTAAQLDIQTGDAFSLEGPIGPVR